jgi:hypothetical protein
MVTHPAREAVVADTTDDAGKARASKAKVVRHAGMVVAMVTGKARETIKATAITRGKALKVMVAKATVVRAATVDKVVAKAKLTTAVVRVATVIKARDSKVATRVAADNNVVKVVADATANSKVATVVVKAATRTSSGVIRVGTIFLALLLTSLLNPYLGWMCLVKTSCWHHRYPLSPR